ncbi:beta-ketoacyl-ACP synthase III [Solihabitans fulvus]|nr:beta-ketoacyl-ACP synthase III [Solihabitans fulvus]
MGLGAYRPARAVSNAEVCELIDSDDEWIRRRTGIVSRRFAGPDEDVVSMAVEAGARALEQAGLPGSRLDTIVLASMTHLQQSPGAAPQVAHRLGSRAAAMDVNAACAGFCHGLAVADSLVRSRTADHVLVIGSDKMTDVIDPTDRSTAFLFADGAGAVVVGPSESMGIGPVAWGSDGDLHHLIAHSASWLELRDKPDLPWPTMRMAGQEVFRWTTREVPATARTALALAGLAPADLAAFIPHQANLRIIEKVAKEIDLPPHVAIARDIVTAGNTSAASIPLAMAQLVESGEVADGGAALLIGFGAGLTQAAQVVQLP